MSGRGNSGKYGNRRYPIGLYNIPSELLRLCEKNFRNKRHYSQYRKQFLSLGMLFYNKPFDIHYLSKFYLRKSGGKINRAILDFFLDNHFIEKSGLPGPGIAQGYKMHFGGLHHIYTRSEIFFPDIHRAMMGRYQKHQEINIKDPELAKFYKRHRFLWDGEIALLRLMDIKYIPEEKRQHRWTEIRSLPTNTLIKCNWEQKPWKKGGRIYSRNPYIQGISKIFRRPGIISEPLEPLFQIDYTAQFFNMVRALQNLPPIDSIWEEIQEKTGFLSKGLIKSVVNPAFQNQTKENWLYNQQKAGNDDENNVKIYEEIKKALRDFKIPEINYAKNIFLGYASLIFNEITVRANENDINMILPLYDGCVIRGTEKQANKLNYIFHQASKKYLKYELPTKLSIITYEKESKL